MSDTPEPRSDGPFVDDADEQQYLFHIEAARAARYTVACWRCRHTAPRGGDCSNCGAYNGEGK